MFFNFNPFQNPFTNGIDSVFDSVTDLFKPRLESPEDDGPKPWSLNTEQSSTGFALWDAVRAPHLQAGAAFIACALYGGLSDNPSKIIVGIPAAIATCSANVFLRNLPQAHLFPKVVIESGLVMFGTGAFTIWALLQ